MTVPCKGATASVLGERYHSETLKIFLDLGFEEERVEVSEQVMG